MYEKNDINKMWSTCFGEKRIFFFFERKRGLFCFLQLGLLKMLTNPPYLKKKVTVDFCIKEKQSKNKGQFDYSCLKEQNT